jgi:hypothetical protein
MTLFANRSRRAGCSARAVPAAVTARPARAAVRLLLSTLLAAAPLGAQEASPPTEAPQSILPDLFDGPPDAAAGTPQAPVPILPEGAAAPAPSAPGPLPPLPPIPQAEAVPLADPLADMGGPEGQPELAGMLTPATTGYAPDLFAGSDARFLARLLDGLEAPLASRWAQIMLQRALLSRTIAPPGLDAADWLAARVRALVRLGAAADAHRMMGAIALDRYTDALIGAGGGAALAAGDPVGLCPIAVVARGRVKTAVWQLTDGMCAALAGDDFAASMRLDALRERNRANPFDVGLAERIAASVGGARRAANPEWSEASALTAWRIGLASAAGLAIPDELVAAATPAQKAWIARLAGQSLARRAALAPGAAAIGAMSGGELGRLLAAEAATLDQGAVARSPGGLLRSAMTAAEPAERVRAMRSLWARAAEGTTDHYGWRIATASAAATLPPSPDLQDAAADIVASLLSVGLVPAALAWWPVLEAADEPVRARAHVALAAVDGGIAADERLVSAFAAGTAPHRAALVRAGLEGLGRLPRGNAVAALDNPWTRAMERAVAGRRLGEAMILAATAMQAGWSNVPPDHLRRIAAALSALGARAEAGLIVAEAAERG